MKKLILWDIDGTLIVSQGAGVRAMEGAFTKRFGLPGDLTKIDWAGRTDSWLTAEVLRYNGITPTPENCHEFLEAYLELLPDELLADELLADELLADELLADELLAKDPLVAAGPWFPARRSSPAAPAGVSAPGTGAAISSRSTAGCRLQKIVARRP